MVEVEEIGAMPDVPDLPGDAGERRVSERGAAGPGRRRDQVVAFVKIPSNHRALVMHVADGLSVTRPDNYDLDP